jgi:hypothetical protein
MVRPRREPHLGWTPARVSHWICDPNNLGHGVVPTVFWGSETARGGKKLSIEISPNALNLMTVQPKADPPQAETGAHQTKCDTDRLKTGARDSNGRTLTSCLQGKKRKFFLRGKVCAYLTVRLMGDPKPARFELLLQPNRRHQQPGRERVPNTSAPSCAKASKPARSGGSNIPNLPGF